MAVKKNKKANLGYTRVTADFAPQAYTILETVAGKLNTNKAEAIRKALGLILFYLNQQEKGNKFIVESEDGSKRTEIVTL